MLPPSRPDEAPKLTRFADDWAFALRLQRNRLAGGTPGTHPDDRRGSENTAVDLARIGWLVTVVACLIAALVLGIRGLDGYALVTLAVAVSAAINLIGER